MLEDRYYMRRSPFQTRRSATVMLLIVNVLAFLGQLAAGRFSDFPVFHYFALSLRGLEHGYVWQLLTFQFMHAGWLHLLLNCWVIYVFGRELEETLGVRRFLTLYFASGVVGGLVQALAGLTIGGAFAASVVGASAGAFGLVAAFAALYPERPLMLLLFFIIPVSMRAKFLLLFSGLVAVLGMVFPSDNVAHAAHLGGMLMGIFFVRYALHWEFKMPDFLANRRKPPLRLVKVPSGPAAKSWARAKTVDAELPPEDFFAKEVDPILDKISAQGIQSLTDRERRILQAAREKMAKR